jgi:hypothetical protein
VVSPMDGSQENGGEIETPPSIRDAMAEVR